MSPREHDTAPEPRLSTGAVADGGDGRERGRGPPPSLILPVRAENRIIRAEGNRAPVSCDIIRKDTEKFTGRRGTG